MIVALLLAGGAAASIYDAVQADSMTDLKAALKADPTALDKTSAAHGGQSPLMHAVLSGKARAVQFLLKKGADPKVAEKDGYTPMHGAGFQGRAQIATLLIANGIDPWDVHQDGHTPMQRVCATHDGMRAGCESAYVRVLAGMLGPRNTAYGDGGGFHPNGCQQGGSSQVPGRDAERGNERFDRQGAGAFLQGRGLMRCTRCHAVVSPKFAQLAESRSSSELHSDLRVQICERVSQRLSHVRPGQRSVARSP
jgi:hypothetical protein